MRSRGFAEASIGAAAVSRALLDAADTRVVLADHTRWNAPGVAVFADLSTADLLITDGGLPEEAVQILESKIDHVVLAGGAGGVRSC
jgi:DeoR/GlpR family transcriptional regulator of sugar metabolism